MSQTPSKLERRARALLRAYPAEYRHGRAEEIIGTLLEAAPPGRSFPPAREAWSLIAGGRHARATRNRRPGVTASTRLALLLGLSTCLSAYLSEVVSDSAIAGNALGFHPGGGVPWPAGTTLALSLALALAPWLGSRAATTALAVPAGALAAYVAPSATPAFKAQLALLLIVMAALAALSGGPVRLPRSWLWLPCAFPLALAAGGLLSPRHANGHRLGAFLDLGTWLLLAVVVACWLVTDARPAFGFCFVRLLITLLGGLSRFAYPESPSLNSFIVNFLLESAVLLPVLLPAAWLLLRRQKTPGPLPYPEP